MVRQVGRVRFIVMVEQTPPLDFPQTGGVMCPRRSGPSGHSKKPVLNTAFEQTNPSNNHQDVLGLLPCARFYDF